MYNRVYKWFVWIQWALESEWIVRLHLLRCCRITILQVLWKKWRGLLSPRGGSTSRPLEWYWVTAINTRYERLFSFACSPSRCPQTDPCTPWVRFGRLPDLLTGSVCTPGSLLRFFLLYPQNSLCTESFCSHICFSSLPARDLRRAFVLKYSRES